MKKIVFVFLAALLFSLQLFSEDALKTYTAVSHDKEHSPKLQADGKIRIGCNLGWFIAWDMTCSGFHDPAGNAGYGPNNLCDFNWHTAWVEGADGYGEGEWVEFHFREKDGKKTDPALSLGALSFYNGYIKSSKAWKNNSRVKTLGVLCNGKKIFSIRLADTMDDQTVQFAPLKIQPGLALGFAIEEVYPGDKYKDTAITEIILDDGNCLGEE